MKYLILPLALVLSSCAHTIVRKNGRVILDTQANARLLVFKQGDTYLYIDGLNHSTPTRAGGSVVGTAGTAIVSGITAAAAL